MKALILITSMILTACGTVIPKEKGSLKLTDETPDFIAKEKTPVAPGATETVTSGSEESSDNSVVSSVSDGEPGNNSVTIQSLEPRTPEQQRLDQMGVDYFISGQTVYVRERDYLLAEAAIADFASPSAWVLALRPDDETLTSTGFQSIPSLAIILGGQGIAEFEVEGLNIYIDESLMNKKPLVLQILAVFYPDTAWDVLPRLPAEEGEGEPENEDGENG